MYLETARLESHQQVLCFTALCTIMDTAASAEWKNEINQIYNLVVSILLPLRIKKMGLSFQRLTLSMSVILRNHGKRSSRKRNGRYLMLPCAKI